jgi:hypothetical protein
VSGTRLSFAACVILPCPSPGDHILLVRALEGVRHDSGTFAHPVCLQQVIIVIVLAELYRMKTPHFPTWDCHLLMRLSARRFLVEAPPHPTRALDDVARHH